MGRVERGLRALPLWLLLPWLLGCGARTALLDDRRRDAGADAQPEDAAQFPCNYSRSGELSTLVEAAELFTAEPALDWGEGRLAVALRAYDTSAPGRSFFAGFGVTDAERGFRVEGLADAGASTVGQLGLAWDGEAFGVVFRDQLDMARLRFQRYEPEGQPLLPEAATAYDGFGSVRGLRWSAGHYLLAVDLGRSPDILVYRVSVEGRRDPIPLVEATTIATEDPPFDLAAEGEVAAAAWVSSEGLTVGGVQGVPSEELVLEAWPGTGQLALAVRGEEAAVLWSEGDGPWEEHRVLMTRLDLDSGEVGPSVELGRGSGMVVGMDLVTVAEGFVAAWNVQDWTGAGGALRVEVTPTRLAAVLGIEVRGGMVIHDGGDPHAGFYINRPALAYDGLDLYLAFEDAMASAVKLQRLSCHR